MLFLRVLEGTFFLTIISLCSNANHVGDLKILTPTFVFFYCQQISALTSTKYTHIA